MDPDVLDLPGVVRVGLSELPCEASSQWQSCLCLAEGEAAGSLTPSGRVTTFEVSCDFEENQMPRLCPAVNFLLHYCCARHLATHPAPRCSPRLSVPSHATFLPILHSQGGATWF